MGRLSKLKHQLAYVGILAAAIASGLIVQGRASTALYQNSITNCEQLNDTAREANHRVGEFAASNEAARVFAQATYDSRIVEYRKTKDPYAKLVAAGALKAVIVERAVHFNPETITDCYKITKKPSL